MGLIRDTELKESNVLMENREMPILYELTNLFETETFLSVEYLPDRQKRPSLRDLCVSVVNANSFVL
jgi:hypothetical protein